MKAHEKKLLDKIIEREMKSLGKQIKVVNQIENKINSPSSKA